MVIIGVATPAGDRLSDFCSSADRGELMKILPIPSKKEKTPFLGNDRDEGVCYDKKRKKTERDSCDERIEKPTFFYLDRIVATR